LRAEHRDLRTRQTGWEADGLPYLPHQTLERSIETDVIIVGPCISGALTADSLTEAGMRVVIVDRRGAVRGSTVATTALVLFEIDTPLVDLARHLGWARAERAQIASLAPMPLLNELYALLDYFECAFRVGLAYLPDFFLAFFFSVQPVEPVSPRTIAPQFFCKARLFCLVMTVQRESSRAVPTMNRSGASSCPACGAAFAAARGLLGSYQQRGPETCMDVFH
jgi:hypothetical protein